MWRCWDLAQKVSVARTLAFILSPLLNIFAAQFLVSAQSNGDFRTDTLFLNSLNKNFNAEDSRSKDDNRW